ncbi:MAG TPA: hypothetical protein GX501_07610 [Clostridiaceae bacterium]|nr:hypothetical protein [Clostridiaceae bacterium]
MSVIRAFIIALRSVISVMQVVLVFRVACEFILIKRDCWPFRFLQSISEPLLEPVRKLLKRQDGKPLRFDFSPLFLVILLYLVNVILKRLV